MYSKIWVIVFQIKVVVSERLKVIIQICLKQSKTRFIYHLKNLYVKYFTYEITLFTLHNNVKMRNVREKAFHLFVNLMCILTRKKIQNL